MLRLLYNILFPALCPLSLFRYYFRCLCFHLDSFVPPKARPRSFIQTNVQLQPCFESPLYSCVPLSCAYASLFPISLSSLLFWILSGVSNISFRVFFMSLNYKYFLEANLDSIRQRSSRAFVLYAYHRSCPICMTFPLLLGEQKQPPTRQDILRLFKSESSVRAREVSVTCIRSHGPRRQHQKER